MLRREGIEAYRFDGAEAEPGLEQALGEAEAIVVSIPPREGAGATLERFGPTIAASRALRRVAYYSTIGVYGDHGGAWVDETSATRTRTARGLARLEDEARWTAAARARGAEADILRLAGIYGPGRNALVNLDCGQAGESSSQARSLTAPMSMTSLRFPVLSSRATLTARSGMSPTTSRRRRKT